MHWTLQGTLWITGFILELAIAVLLFRKRLHREFPFFFTYLVLELVRTTLLFAIRPGHPPYFYTFWITECLIALFGFVVVEEVFRKAFSKQLGLQKIGITVFRFMLVVLVIGSVVVAAAAPGNDASKLVAAILVLKRAQSFIRVGLVASLFVFVWLLGVPWSSYVTGIATGFAIYGTVELALLAVRSHYGSVANRTYSWTLMGANLCQKLVWALYCIPKAPDPPIASSRDEDHYRAEIEVQNMREAVDTFLKR